MDTLLQVAASWILPALFFWFLFSVMAMTIIELIQRIMKSRQKGLEDVIKKLLGKEKAVDFYNHALVNPLEDEKKDQESSSFVSVVVKRIFKKDDRPSYISSSLFAKIVMDWMLEKAEVKKQEEKDSHDAPPLTFVNMMLNWVFKKNQNGKPEAKDKLNEIIQKNIKAMSQKDPQMGEVLRTIVTQAYMKTDKVSEFLELIQKDLKAWFLEAVGQMSSVYGARLQFTTFLVSAIVALVANFDVIDITRRLWETSKYPELLALFEKNQLTSLVDKNLFLRLPVGWYSDSLPSTPVELALKIAGIFLGAFLIAIGSQYVFNLTKKQYKPSE